jgi:hypothetical protein
MVDSRCTATGRRHVLRAGLVLGLLGALGCGDQGGTPAPPKSPGETGNRARLDKFKENAEAALSKKKKG